MVERSTTKNMRSRLSTFDRGGYERRGTPIKNKPPMAFHALRIEIDARRDEMGHVLLRDVAEHGEERGDGKHVLWSLNSAVERESVTM